jgi:large conductance mechanosensitive channel
MSLTKEFKEFISRGNVVDLAVGVIIGAAFGKIVSSLVADIIMPPIGFIIGGINFSALKIILKQPAIDPITGKPIEALTLNYGMFLQATLDFLIIAAAIFLFVKLFNTFKRKEEAPPPAQTAEEKLLTEIRDLLAAKKS